jgi:hypothetical protein
MLSAICRTCFLEWTLALPGCGRRLATGIGSMAICWTLLVTADWEATGASRGWPGEIDVLESQSSAVAAGPRESLRRFVP